MNNTERKNGDNVNNSSVVPEIKKDYKETVLSLIIKEVEGVETYHSHLKDCQPIDYEVLKFAEFLLEKGYKLKLPYGDGIYIRFEYNSVPYWIYIHALSKPFFYVCSIVFEFSSGNEDYEEEFEKTPQLEYPIQFIYQVEGEWDELTELTEEYNKRFEEKH